MKPIQHYLIPMLGLTAIAAMHVLPLSAENHYPLPRTKPDGSAQKPVPRLKQPANQLFGGQPFPAKLKARSHGTYYRGCLAGGKMLDMDGPHWQAMRLSRNRNWGHPTLVAYIEKLAADAKALDGWPGLLVGDLSQPRGGPMLSGHTSHQIGLDGDIWLLPAPEKPLTVEQREKISSISMIKDNRTLNAKTWTQAHAKLIRRAASYPQVARIFVHPVIKKALCDWAKGDRRWLRRVRPWYGHHYHFHVRLKCPRGSRGCKNQSTPPPGDGCKGKLAWWLSAKPWKPKPKKPAAKRRPITLAHLPQACRKVLDAD